MLEKQQRIKEAEVAIPCFEENSNDVIVVGLGGFGMPLLPPSSFYHYYYHFYYCSLHTILSSTLSLLFIQNTMQLFHPGQSRWFSLHHLSHNLQNTPTGNRHEVDRRSWSA